MMSHVCKDFQLNSTKEWSRCPLTQAWPSTSARLAMVRLQRKTRSLPPKKKRSKRMEISLLKRKRRIKRKRRTKSLLTRRMRSLLTRRMRSLLTRRTVINPLRNPLKNLLRNPLRKKRVTLRKKEVRLNQTKLTRLRSLRSQARKRTLKVTKRRH